VKNLHLLPVAAILALFAFAAQRAAAQMPVEFMVEMRDGVRLATDVYVNLLDPDPKPAILMRTPYGKRAEYMMVFATFFVGGGYAVVIQDTRGTGESEGENDLFESAGWGERQDGYDTVEWVASQVWCDGKVGMFGVSALGINAYLAAGARPPSLVCEAVAFAAGDLYDEAAYQGGELRASLVDNWVGDQNPGMIQTILDHQVRDSYWDLGDAEARQALINVPTLHVGGWYDIFLQGTLDHFAGLQTRGDVGARGNQKLIVGPWTHGNVGSRRQGELEYPANSLFTDMLDVALDWFDYWLKGEDTGIMDEPPVRYYLMGDVDEDSSEWNKWCETDTWPPPCWEARLYLWGDGTLRARPVESGSPAVPESYAYDPDDPVPTIGGANLEIDAGPYDQRPVESRADVLVYSTEELTEPLEITGRVWVELYAASSATDTDWTAKLCDVYPDGRSMLVCDGILRGRCRESVTSPTLLAPGTIYRFAIDLWSTSLVFNRGHRIRLEISSSNAPRFEPNPNNGRPIRSGDPPVVATNTVYHDRFRPSALVLPVTSPPPDQHPLFADAATGVRSRWVLYR